MILNDRIQLDRKRRYTDEGFMVLPATISRSGIQEYYAAEMGLIDDDPTRVIRVYRPPEEVFDKESLDSFANKTVTDDHPPEMVNAYNSKKYAVGHSGSTVDRNGIFAQTELFITASTAIESIEDGKVEVSNGYTSDIEWTQGVSPEGERYDAIQRNIRGNHIALVSKGRCGSQCRVSDSKPTNEESPMKITIDGVDYEVSDQAAQAVVKLQRNLADMSAAAEKEKEDNLENLKKKEDEIEEIKKDHQKSMDARQAKIDDALSKAPTPAMIDKLVENRIATRDAACRLVPDYKFEGKDCEAIRKEVVATINPKINVDEKSVEYIRAAFDIAAEGVTNDGIVSGLLSKGSAVDSAPLTPSQKARADKIQRDAKRFNRTGGDK